MRQQLLVLALGALLAWVPQLSADTLTYDFSSPTGVLGASQAYMSDGATVTARGYSGVSTPTMVGSPTDLFGKALGGDENGVGISGTPNNEIQDNFFVQLDLTDVFSKFKVTSEQLAMGSVQEGDAYDIYGSNTLGVPGTKIISAGTLNGTLFDIPNFGNYSFISAAAADGDVLLSQLSLVGTAIPEPSSLALAAVGLGSLVGWLRKSRRAKA
jgi:hypothetical protein